MGGISNLIGGKGTTFVAVIAAAVLLGTPGSPVDFQSVHYGHSHGRIGEFPVSVADIQASGPADPSGQAGSGERAVVHHSGARPITDPSLRSAAPDARLFRTGMTAIEPTLGVTNKGSVFYTGMNTAPFRPEVMRSKDDGSTWEIVSPKQGGKSVHATTQDPYTYVDDKTSRVFTIDYAGCFLSSYSDDEGESWTTAPPVGCGYNFDHQSLFAGPPVTSTPRDYPNVVYLCTAGFGALSQYSPRRCAQSRSTEV